MQAEVELRNTGSAPATVGEFRTDFTCMEVYQLDEGVKRTVAKLVVAPGGSQKVFLDLRTSGQPGTRLASGLYFRDLETESGEYRVAVTYTPVARVYVVPRTVVFGDIPAGEPATRRLEVRSDGTYTGGLGGLRCSRPELFSLEVVPPTQDEQAKFAAEFRGQYLLGYFDLSLRPGSQAANYDDILAITNDAGEFLRLPITARGLAEYSAAPSRLTLPRVEGGKPVYMATVMLRARAGQVFRASAECGDAPLVVAFPDPAAKDGPILAKVRYTGPIPPTGREFTLWFHLTGDAGEFELPLPVSLLPPNE